MRKYSMKETPVVVGEVQFTVQTYQDADGNWRWIVPEIEAGGSCFLREKREDAHKHAINYLNERL
ncbi:MAG: hypothetical protein ISS48_02930 [Candidatus Aenigmarchaeota archaeon]|nr:hypothetical protein [Candidatus Aenigmarchaeota archaeon]